MHKNRVWKFALIAMASLMGTARADLIANLQLYDGTSLSPIVTVSYTDPNGLGHYSAETYADPQVNGGTQTPIYYCIDLWHDNFLGSSYAITPVSSISYASSTFSDTDNRLAWLVNQPQDTVDERAAIQLAMWYTADSKGFSYSGGDATLQNNYDALIGFVGYDPAVSYNAQLWSATHDPGNTLYQDLITAGPGTVPTDFAAVPEPNTLLLTSLALESVLAYHVARRRRRAALPA